MPNESSRILVLGATGLVGRGLMSCSGFQDAMWAGRSDFNGKNYYRLKSYDSKELKPLLAEANLVVHLAALTRDRRAEKLNSVNRDFPFRIAEQLFSLSPRSRFVFLSSDLAACRTSPYGRSKRAAEELIADLQGDSISLRASMLALPSLAGRTTTMGSLIASSTKAFVPIPGDGCFQIAPLWIQDLANVLVTLGKRRGESSDQGVWECQGESIQYRNLILKLAEMQQSIPRLIPVPLFFLRIVGRMLGKINPTTKFPVDFLESLKDPPGENPPDIFTHLKLERTPQTDWLNSLLAEQ